MDAEVLTYSRAKGAFAGLDLTGAAIRQDDDSMKAVYGPDVNQRAVLDGQVKPTPAATPFLSAIRGAREQALDKK
jgi:lipid-binding SYLF domain-containing protein